MATVAAALDFLVDRLPTPIGELLVVADAAGRLRAVDWADYEHRLNDLLRTLYRGREVRLRPAADPGGASTAFAAYFAGDLAAIDSLPVETGGTAFQKAVWQALRSIPCGRTITYRALAERAGRPAAIRAAGHANGSNPLSVVLPCHRVIGTDGTLTGYGGGLERKRWLLRHEGALRGPAAPGASG
ncbi:MAG: methylated-DNA--[protein]-cysteine S-methyltransferase [Thalassobaculum sp.]|uniref:methylated-DNA--[protein]-cysteine S-methyltransferase n=1 Tax=Thalassobaculum sp. TaxID=2022740 RepID=UPI0032F06B0F